MWRAVGTSVAGTSHVELNVPCQDYSAYERVVIGSAPAFIIAIADGAGSARLSHVGAQEVVGHLLRIIPLGLQSVFDVNEYIAREWLNDARAHLQEVSTRERCELRELGSTILVAILTDLASFFIQIGDGAWIIERDGEYVVATWPSDGEYVNETTFLTSPNWADSMKYAVVTGAASAVAGLTDGLQRLALQFDSRSVHAPFFEPLFRVLRAAEDESSLISPLIEFLSSDRVAERTDDDKTLVLACRTEPLFLPDAN
jgi:serine/threonine protein phosphatase PrpC